MWNAASRSSEREQALRESEPQNERALKRARRKLPPEEKLGASLRSRVLVAAFIAFFASVPLGLSEHEVAQLVAAPLGFFAGLLFLWWGWLAYQHSLR